MMLMAIRPALDANCMKTRGHLELRDANGRLAIVFVHRDQKCVWHHLQWGDAK
jgi:hypothetical protein